MLTVDFCRVFQSQLHFSFFVFATLSSSKFEKRNWLWKTKTKILPSQTGKIKNAFVSIMLRSTFLRFEKVFLVFKGCSTKFRKKSIKKEYKFVKNEKNRCEHDAHNAIPKKSILLLRNVFHSQLHFSFFGVFSAFFVTFSWQPKISIFQFFNSWLHICCENIFHTDFIC